jgi:hypothetical protein
MNGKMEGVMTEPSDNAWGHVGRYYSTSEAAMPGKLSGADDQDIGPWGKALNEVSPGIREDVERTCKQWNSIIRDYLRNETALRLTAGGRSQSVPIKIDDGMPDPFYDVMHRFRGLEWLLLNRPALLAAVNGTRFMGRNASLARDAWGDAAGPAKETEINRVRETAEGWLRKLDDLEALEPIFATNEDVLGAYFFLIPEIRIYWVVIGITARLLGVSVESLTVVVLAHELAHAYTHLGYDIDSEQWDTKSFAQSDLNIVEGLAQFYTEVVCKRLERRMPSALVTYKKLLERQSGPYRAQLEWIRGNEHGGEIIRVSMIECRSKGLTKASTFNEAIERYRIGVRGRSNLK